jgi:hypothetical protein
MREDSQSDCSHRSERNPSNYSRNCDDVRQSGALRQAGADTSFSSEPPPEAVGVSGGCALFKERRENQARWQLAEARSAVRESAIAATAVGPALAETRIWNPPALSEEEAMPSRYPAERRGQERKKAPLCRTFRMRSSGLEPPRAVKPTRPSTRYTGGSCVSDSPMRPFYGRIGTQRTFWTVRLLSNFCQHRASARASSRPAAPTTFKDLPYGLSGPART